MEGQRARSAAVVVSACCGDGASTAPCELTATSSVFSARFSPDDKFSRQRVLLKKRFNLLPTQQEALQY